MTVLDPTTQSILRRRVSLLRATPTLLIAGAVAVINGCTPATPRIDGGPGAPASPQTQWPVPRKVQTPPPESRPPSAPTAATALHADSSTIGASTQLSMTDVVDLALRNNPATRESWATARAAADQYGAARGILFPSIDGSVGLSRAGSSTGSSGLNNLDTGLGTVGTGVDTTPARSGSSGITTRSQLTPGLTLSYLVFDLGGRAGTIEAAKQRAISSDLLHNTTVQNVVLQVESALFSYLATRSLRDADLISLREEQADTAAAEARLRVGVGTLEEVLQTRTSLAQVRLQLATDAGSLIAARGSLSAAMGFTANTRFDVPMITTSDSIATIAASVDTLINRAITQRPDLAGARADAEALAAQVRIARSAGYPALTLSTTANYARQLQGTSTTVGGRNYSLVLGLQVPIFNGFSREYDVRAARDLYEAGLARVTSTMQQITVQVFASYSALQTATERVAAAGELLTSAQQSADVALGRYREGVGTIVDLLLARTALATARSEEIQSRWEWRTALAQLAHDTGSLDTGGRPNIPLGPGPGIRR